MSLKPKNGITVRISKKTRLSAQDKIALEAIRRDWNQEQEKKMSRDITTMPNDWLVIKERIKKSDNHTCVVCGLSESMSTKLTVHHRDGNQKNISPSNLITLCIDCHDKLPVPPFSERYYCHTIIFDFPKSICIRLGFKGGNRSPQNCEFYDIKHGCLLEIMNIRKLGMPSDEMSQLQQTI